MRKTISLVLAVLMVLALLPAVKLSSASADSVEKTYTLVSSADDLTADGSYLVVSANAAGEAKALANQKSNNRGVADVTVTEDLTIVLTSDQLAAAADDAKPFELKLGGNAADGWSFYDEIGNGFLFAPCAVNSSNGKAYNYMRTQAENNDNGLFTITIDGETYTIVSKGGNIETDAVYMRFNSGASCISCYTAGSSVQAPVYLYKLTSATDSGDPEPEPEPEPEGTEMELVTELEDGDEVVIYYPTESKVMTGEDYLYNNRKHELVSAAATLTDGVLAVPEEALLLTVGKEVGEDDIARYTFETKDGKFLEADGTNVQLVEEAGANTIFQLEAAEGGYYIKCDTAQYQGKAQYIEYYSGYFTVYSMGSNTAIYTFQFYAEPKDTPVEPVEPTGDTIVLFTNDVHCGIRDGWGYAGLADLKKTLEAEGNEVILVDAGDHVQGGPIGSLTQGEAIIDIMNFVGYDLATLGNHEFDYGMDQMFALTEQAEFPYVSANFVKVEGNEPVFDAYKIFEANGKKIAFVGLSTPESITKSTPTYFMNEDNTAYVYGFCQDATGEGVYTAAQAAIDAAKEEGADYVILVGHMGIDEQSSPWMSTEVIANVTGADAFIDGHSHSVINTVVEDKEGNSVLHGQTGTKLANVGKLTIAADGTLTMELLPASEKVKDDPETDEYIKSIEDEFNALLNTVVAHTDHDLTILDPDTNNRAVRSKETNLGDLCADAYRFMFDADVAFVNGGGVRANIPTGDITFQQIINVHPFGNTAVLAEVTGQQILDALEHGAASNPGESGGFLQVAGLKYEIHNYLPANEIVDDQKMWVSNAGLDEYRVKNVQVLNKETGEYEDLDLTKTYTLASHNYMLMGNGDGYAMFGKKNITILNDSGIADNKVLIDYIQSMPEVDGVHQVEGYTDPRGEGRITIYAEAPTPVEPTGDTIILFTNDVHCGIRDGWGYAGLADLKKTLEAEGNEVILVDAGDHVQGGPIGSLTQGEAIIDIMNFVGYDLATLGNHEFDYGMDQMFALVEQAEYPYVSANFVKVEGNEPVFDAYKIFEANGKKIAFVGLSTPESITKSTPTYFMNEDNTAYVYGFCQDETGAGVYTAAQNAIDAAKAEGADYVILVGHMGIDEQSQPWTAPEVIANITGADAFIDGHSHSVINTVVEDKEGNSVLHGQTGTKLANVGKLTIAADGTLTMELLPASEKVKDDPETDEYIKGIEDEFNALLNTVVAHTDHDLTILDPDTNNRAVRSKETNLGDLCADAYRFMFDADVAFVNGGGVRANIPTGDITFQQIINVHPFGNTAVLAEVTGQQILDALEMGARVNPGENGGFLQVAGLKYEIHNYIEPNCVVGTDKMWAGPVDASLPYRVQNVRILNKETGEYEDLDLTKKYTLASHNYMLMDMGDGFAMFGPNITILEDSGKLDNQVLIDYIQSMPEVDGVHQVEGYTDPRGEGRITIVSEPTATIYGEDLLAADVIEVIDGEEFYRYDVKIKNIDPKVAVVGVQAFVQYDSKVFEFVKATSELEGSTGVNEENDVISFAWATDGDGITIEDDAIIVSLHFRLKGAVVDGTAIPFTFVTAANGGTTGYSYVEDNTVVEAANIALEDGSITFAAPDALTIYGEDVMSLDVMTVEDGERLYRYDIRMKDLPNAGLSVNSAQIFVECDSILEFRKAEGMLEWQSADKDGKLMFSWASDTAVLLNNEDIVLTIWFAAPNAKGGDVATVKFTTNVLDTVSAMSFMYGDQLIELEAETIDGSITFAEVVLGDANCDGKVTAADAALILRVLVGLNELSAQGALNADVDGDCEITAEDAAIILRYIVKLIDKFPVE